MSEETELTRRGGFRFSREISLGDLVVAVGGLAIVFKLYFASADHERRIVAAEGTLVAHAQTLAQHETAIAVLQDRAGGYLPVGPIKQSQQLINRDK